MRITQHGDIRIEWDADNFLKEFDADFQKLVIEKAAKNIEKNAKMKCPVGEARPAYKRAYKKRRYKYKAWTAREMGALKKSIKAYPSKFKGKGWIVIAGGVDTYYAPKVELGTKYMTARPYLRPAFHEEMYKMRHYLTDVRKRSRYLKTR